MMFLRLLAGTVVLRPYVFVFLAVYLSLSFSFLLEPLIYVGVVCFNLTLTFAIGERLLGLVGCMLYAPLNAMRRTGKGS